MNITCTRRWRRAFVTLSAVTLTLSPAIGLRVASAGSGNTEDYGIPDGYTIVEGDIVVPTDFYETLALRGCYRPRLWPDGIVPYEFNANVTDANQQLMLAAMAEWEAVAGVDFRPHDGSPGSYIHIMDGPLDWSFVGRKGGKQEMMIHHWHWRFMMAHELGHALGLWHEQSRPDRDTYVDIITGNIRPDMVDQFAIVTTPTEFGAYDFDSVMHYEQCAFSQCSFCPESEEAGCTLGGITIDVLPPWDVPWQNQIGQRTHLSDGDKATMAFLYPGPAPHMIVVLDRSGSMMELRANGHSRCNDALALARGDVVQYFANHLSGSVAVWTFAGADPTDLTAGFAGEADALAALDALDPEGCDGSTPLAEAICEASDAITVAFPAAVPAEKFIAISSDGGENFSDGECWGFPSITGPPPPGNYFPGSWQSKVYNKLLGQNVVKIRYWGSVTKRSERIDVETGELRERSVSDAVFFEDLAESNEGSFVDIDDAAPIGACCLPIGACAATIAADCVASEGTYLGDGAVCAGDFNQDGIDEACDAPTVTEWGLISLALLLLVGGKIYFGQRRMPQA